MSRVVQVIELPILGLMVLGFGSYLVSLGGLVALVALIALLGEGVRRYRRRVRQRMIGEIRAMLRDVVNSQLAIIETSTYLAERSATERQRHLDQISDSIQRIALTLESLSDEALRQWRARHNTSKDRNDICPESAPAAR